MTQTEVGRGRFRRLSIVSVVL